MVDTPKDGKMPEPKTDKDGGQQSIANPEISDLIGQRLRTFYEATAKQPIPERFLELLAQLEKNNPPEDKK